MCGGCRLSWKILPEPGWQDQLLREYLEQVQEPSKGLSMQSEAHTSWLIRYFNRQIQLFTIKPFTHGGGLSVCSCMCAAKWSQLGERNI